MHWGRQQSLPAPVVDGVADGGGVV